MSSVAPSAVADGDELPVTSELVKLIHPDHCKSKQVARWRDAKETFTFKLLRKPVDLTELNDIKYCMALWRDNGTLTYLTPDGEKDCPKERCLSLAYLGGGPTLNIVGRSKKAVAQTAAYFMGLEKHTDQSFPLFVSCSSDSACDFSAAGSRCLSRAFKAAPSRSVDFSGIKLRVEQSVVLATRPHPVALTFTRCEFEDAGTAFVDALEKRKSSFGTLEFDGGLALSDDNVKRLLQLDNVIDELTLTWLSDEIALLPFSAKVRRLDYNLCMSSISEADLALLDIVTNKLCMRIGDKYEINTFPTDSVLSLFRRVADLGHFVELTVKFLFDEKDYDIPESVVQELINAALANGNLQVLDLTTTDVEIEWDSHVETLFRGLQDHKGLDVLKIEVQHEAFGPQCFHLEQLISYNRRIRVIDEEGRLYSSKSIDGIYSLNDFYLGSASLVSEPLSERSSLVATVLTESASGDLQRSALLLSNHTDALYDLVQYARLAESDENDSSSQPVQDNTRRRKRRRRT